MAENEMTKYRAERLLGLSGTYSEKDLTRAYRVKVKEHHPDLVASRGGNKDAAEEVMIEINKANEHLRSLLQAKSPLTCEKGPGIEGRTPSESGSGAASRRNVRQNGSTANPASQRAGSSNRTPRSDPYGPYGGWDPNSTIGQQYHEGWKKNRDFEQWKAEQEERAERVAAERRAAYAAEHEESVKESAEEDEAYEPNTGVLRGIYSLITHFPLRLLLVLAGVAYILFYGYAMVSGLPVFGEAWFHYVMAVAFFGSILELVFGFVSGIVKGILLFFVKSLDNAISA